MMKILCFIPGVSAVTMKKPIQESHLLHYLLMMTLLHMVRMLLLQTIYASTMLKQQRILLTHIQKTSLTLLPASLNASLQNLVLLKKNVVDILSFDSTPGAVDVDGAVDLDDTTPSLTKKLKKDSQVSSTSFHSTDVDCVTLFGNNMIVKPPVMITLS